MVVTDPKNHGSCDSVNFVAYFIIDSVNQKDCREICWLSATYLLIIAFRVLYRMIQHVHTELFFEKELTYRCEQKRGTINAYIKLNYNTCKNNSVQEILLRNEGGEDFKISD